jgi:asparagine synthase (glutamine-hydrolysing)
LSADVARDASADAESAMLARFSRLEALPWASQMMHFDFETYLPEDVLTKVDRMSMAHSLESRVPLLDNEVIAFAASLPADLKIRDGVRKYVLKAVARDLLPPAILQRGKKGFGVPLGAWFRGNLRELFGDVLHSAGARQRPYFNASFVDRLVEEHLAGRRDHTLRLWQLVVFELWHRQYIDRAPDCVPESGGGVETRPRGALRSGRQRGRAAAVPAQMETADRADG